MEAGERLDAWHIREVVKEGQPKESFWTKIGVAFVNRDGSLNLHLNLIAPDGKIHLRKPKPRTDEASKVNEPEHGPAQSDEDSPF